VALRRGYGEKTIKGGDTLRGPKTFFLPNGTETVVTLVDDLPVEVVVHCQYLKGDKKGNGMRVTCYGLDPQQFPEPCPRECKGCEAMLRYDRIDRKHNLYLTLIDERAFTWEGKHFKDMKRLLELSPDQADLFKRRREAQGSLVGSRWKVYRSKPKNSPRHGDDWNFIGFVDPEHPNDPIEMRMKRHFWQSPAIPNIRQNAQQRENKAMSHEEAAAQLVTPYDYEDLFGTFDPKKMEAFVAYHIAAVGDKASTAASGGGSYQAPPMPQGGPSYAVPAMPTGQAPASPQPQAPPQPPAVPDPASAGGPAYEAPPFPGVAAAPSQGSTAGAPQQPSQIPGAGYQFGPPAAPSPQPSQTCYWFAMA